MKTFKTKPIGDVLILKSYFSSVNGNFCDFIVSTNFQQLTPPFPSLAI